MAQWEVVEADANKATCERAAVSRAKEVRRIIESMGVGDVARTLCLPDTVDPRGPK